MTKFRVKSSNSGSLVGFGLSAENIKRMQEGKPIYIDMAELGFKDLEIAITYGETEASIMEDLKKAGLRFPEAQE